MPYKNKRSTNVSINEKPDQDRINRVATSNKDLGFTVTHVSKKTGSSWLIDFNAQGLVEKASIMTKSGHISKVILSNKKPWLQWFAKKCDIQ